MGPNERLERSQWDFFWVPADAEVLDRPDVAAVRCARTLPHLNMVSRTRAAPDRVEALVREMRSFLGVHRARWLVPDTFDRAPLEAALTRDRWAPVGRYEARAIRAGDYARTPAPGLEVRRVESTDALEDWIDVCGRAFGRDMRLGEAALAAELSQCAPRDGRVHRFVVYRDGAPLSAGGFNWYPPLRFCFLWAGGTVPEARGAGAYTALVAARVDAARAMGAEWVGLYAKDDTSAPIVARQGFEAFGEMRYWAPWTIRAAAPDDLVAVQAVERDAAQRFLEVGFDDVAAMECEPLDALRRAQAEARLHVVDVGGVVVGVALTSTLDGDLHLEEIDVARAHQRRGFGRALVDRVLEAARAGGHRGVTLHTFRGVPWNEPMYRRLGFSRIEPSAMGPELAARTILDAAGFPTHPRVAMRLGVGERR